MGTETGFEVAFVGVAFWGTCNGAAELIAERFMGASSKSDIGKLPALLQEI